jgi:hypothetical protein
MAEMMRLCPAYEGLADLYVIEQAVVELTWRSNVYRTLRLFSA